MPFPNLSRTVQGRAIRQASANTESNEATVLRTYADASGNITAADVRVKGQVAPLVRVPNVSGLKLYVGASVEARFVNGSKHYRTITGASGSSTSLATAAASTSAPAAPVAPGPLLDQSPVLLQSADTLDTPGGYVEAPGANVLFVDTPPGTASGGAAVNGQRLITARPLVAPSLPSPLTTTLPDGTLLDLVDSYGGPLGMYRLDAGARVWRRRDAGSGGGSLSLATASAFGTVETDITETGGSKVYTKTTMDTLLAGKIGVGAALPESEITGLLADLANKITVGAALPESEVTNLVADLAGKIATGMALPESEITNLISDLAGKIATGAALPESEITGLVADLAARLVVVGTPADGQVPTWVAASGQYQPRSPTGGFSPASVQAPASVGFDHADYSGATELITWRARNTATYTAGAIEFYGWRTSPDNSTWTTEVFGGDTYQGVGLTAGNQYAQCRAYPLVTSGGTATPSGWVASAVQAYAAAASGSALTTLSSAAQVFNFPTLGKSYTVYADLSSLGSYAGLPVNAMLLEATAPTVELSWTAPTSGTAPASYNVFRGTTSGSEISYATGITATTWIDNAVTPGTTYYYKVQSVLGSTTSAFTSEVSVAVPASESLLNRPTVAPNFTLWTSSRAAWTVYIPANVLGGYSPAYNGFAYSGSFLATLFVTGWTGGATSGLTPTWGGPLLVG